MDEVKEYAESIHHGLVATRDTLLEVQDYLMHFNGDERRAALIGFHMALNTVSKNLLEMEKA